MRQVGGDPCLGGGIGHLDRGDDGGIDLLCRLDRVAAVDNESCLVPQNDGGAGGSGEAGEPGQALGALWHVLALMLVRARHDEAVKTTANEFVPQSADVLRTLIGGGRIVESLEKRHVSKTKGEGWRWPPR